MKTEVIFGPPGTGKTRTIIKKIKEYGKNDFIFCSFTRAAAKEGLSRLGVADASKARTLHSIAYEKARISQAQVVDRNKLQELADITGYPISGKNIQECNEIQLGDELLALVNLASARQISVEDLYIEIRPEISMAILRSFAKTYYEWKRRYGYLDFNDMLVKFVEGPRMKVRALFIDEAQDLSNLQWQAIRQIDAEYACIAGDDDQAIYSWSGANPHGMIEYADQNNCTPEILSRSYRLPVDIWGLSKVILKKITKRYNKEYSPTMMHPGKIERYGLIDALELEEGSALFLYRNYSNRLPLEEWITNNNLPYNTHNGWGMFDNHIAKAVKKYISIDTLNDNQSRKILQGLRAKIPRGYHTYLNDPKFFRDIGWQDIFAMSPAQRHYLMNVDLDAEPDILLSTIHSAKGMEADHVVLSTAMGQRTWEGLSDDEHRVWYVAVTRAKKSLHLIQGDLGYVI